MVFWGYIGIMENTTEATVECRPMMNNPPPSKGLDLESLLIIPSQGKWFLNHGSTLQSKPSCSDMLSSPTVH